MQLFSSLIHLWDIKTITNILCLHARIHCEVCIMLIKDYFTVDVNRINGVMLSVLASRVVNRGFEHRSGQTKSICCFSAALRRKSKDWLARNQDNVSEMGDMSIRGLLFQWACTIKSQLSVLVQYKAHLIIISLKINLFLPWYSWQIAELALKNSHSLYCDKGRSYENWVFPCFYPCFRWIVLFSYHL